MVKAGEAGGVLAPIGNYPVVVRAWDEAGNMSEKSGQIIIPQPNAAPLPTFTPTPIPEIVAVETEEGEETQEVVALIEAEPAPAEEEKQEEEKKESVFTFASKDQTPTPNTQSTNANILWGATASAAIGAFAAQIAERKRREAEAEAARKRAEREYQKRVWAAGAGRYNQAKRVKAQAAKSSWIAQQTSQWLAEYNKQPEEDPYDDIEEWHERQDRSNAAVIAEYKEKIRRKRIQEAADEIEAEKKIGYTDPELPNPDKLDSATLSYIAMGNAVASGEFSREKYDKAREEKTWWEKPRNWAETITGLVPTFKTAWNVRNIKFEDHTGGYHHIEADVLDGHKLDEFANAASEGWEHGPGGNWAKGNLDDEVAKWVWDDAKGVFGNIGSWFSTKKGVEEVSKEVAQETSEEITKEVTETAIKEVAEEVAETASKQTIREMGGEVLENTVKSGPWDVLFSTAFNIYDYGFGEEKDTGILSQEFGVSTGVDITQSILTGLVAAGAVALLLTLTPL